MYVVIYTIKFSVISKSKSFVIYVSFFDFRVILTLSVSETLR